MTPWTLVRRGLRFHWRTHLGVAGGAAVGTAVLVGALAVGDSVRHSLRETALARLGGVRLALEAPERTFRDALADTLTGEVTRVAPVLRLDGIAVRVDGTARAFGVHVHGVDDRFGALAGTAAVPPAGARDAVVLNGPLARRLGVGPGDTVLLRVERPGLLPRDAPLSGGEGAGEAIRLTVAAVAPDASGGRFSLRAEQALPYNAFVPLALLQERVGLPGRANLLLAGGEGPDPISLVDALRARWAPADAGLELRDLPAGALEMRTSRVFLEAPVAEVALSVPGARGILTYLVNELRVGERATPYSMVSGIGMPGGAGPLPGGHEGRPSAGSWDDLKDDEVAINEWLAQDLQAKPGDALMMAYFVPGPGRSLEERRSRFRIRAVVPLVGEAADRGLMPDFPGVSDVDSCRDWKPGIPIRLDRIRKQDEAYWKERRGTPKAFVSLAAALEMWRNRFGGLTAVRFPPRPGIRGEAESAFRRLDPATLGLVFRPVREEALAAAAQGQDFGGLFLGFSLFLILAALLLTGLLFTLGVEQRAEEAGTLLAVGCTPARVRGLFLLEGGVLAVVGGAAGVGGGILYAKAVLIGLTTVWQPAVGTPVLVFHAEPATLAGGAAAGFLLALAAIGWAVRRLARRPARELLQGGGDAAGIASVPAQGRTLPGLAAAVVCLIAAIAVVVRDAVASTGTGATTFFLSGALLLAGGLAACHALLVSCARRAGGPLTTRRLGLMSAVRRRGRSLAVVSLIACGAFLVAAVGANRKGAGEDLSRREPGTGGFALWATSAIPIVHDLNRPDGRDLNRPDGREALGLDAKVLEGVTVVPMRVLEGDDASCLNLNRAQRPRLLGVPMAALKGRFARADRSDGGGGPGEGIVPGPGGPVIPALADHATVKWALGLSVGDTVGYVDERGRPYRVRIDATLSDSVLQGSLAIDEEAFLLRHPSASGYRMFLIDAPAGRAEAVATELTRALQDYGFEAVPAAQRLAEFHAVENTYLAVFLALGGLGLILGSLGLGVVVARNVLERRGELALLRAVGFEAGRVRRMVVGEHVALMGLGLLCGAGAAGVAVVPVLMAPGAAAPAGPAVVALAAVAASGALWTALAAWWALRGPLLPALRNE
jgi:putative ABC transport system permease protein